MNWPSDLCLDELLIFTLVLTRVSGLVLAAPPFAGVEVPLGVRAWLAVALAVLIAPAQLAWGVRAPQTLLDYLVALGGEVLVGLTLALGLSVFFSGIRLAGQLIGQTSGMSLSEAVNPGWDENVPALSQLLYLLAVAIFFALGGHRQVMSGLLGTFASIPPGGGTPTWVAEAVELLLGQSFSLGICAAAPVTAAVLLATLAAGLVSRTLPQLNFASIGFGATSLVTFVTLSVALGGIAWLFEAEFELALETILEAIH